MSARFAAVALFLLVSTACFAQAPATAVPQKVDPAQFPKQIDALLAAKQFDQAIKLCQDALQADPAAGPTVLPQLARACEAAGKPADAADALVKLVGDKALSVSTADTLVRAGGLYMTANRPEAAVPVYKRVIDEYPKALDDYEAHGGNIYDVNRRVLDQDIYFCRVGASLADAYTKMGKPADAVALRKWLLAIHPEAPQAQTIALQAARDAAEAKDWEAVSVYALRYLNCSGDRGLPFRAKMPENQVWLDAVTKPREAAGVRETLGLIDKAATASTGAIGMESARLDQVAALWVKAEQASYAVKWSQEWADPNGPAAAWRAAATAAGKSSLAEVANLMLSQWLVWRGVYAEAFAGIAPTTEPPKTALGQWEAFTRAESDLYTGNLPSATKAFALAAQGPDPALGAEAELRAAECAEGAGQIDEARGAFEKLAARAGAPTLVCRRAQCGAARLQGAKPGVPGAAAYVGEDRQTEGDWRFYGRDYFILCSCIGSDALAGGKGPLAYKATTTRPSVPIMGWHWTNDPDASNQYDPTDNDRGEHSWGDMGHDQRPGQGPDLVLALPVPAGTYRLGLYFNNDHTYYEPNRRYTIHLTDADKGTLLATAPVRDFLNGVFVQFRVAGPLNLQVHIWRNLALNTMISGVFLDDLDAMPQWEALRAGPLSDEKLALDKPADWTACATAWGSYRATWAKGAGRPAETEVLKAWAVAVAKTLDPYNAGRTVEALAVYLREQGYLGQSFVLEDEALAMVAAQSSRRYAEALLQAVDAYAAPVKCRDMENDGPASWTREMALDLGYAQAKLGQYLALLKDPQSQVTPEGVLAMTGRWAHGNWSAPGLARMCYDAIAPGGDVSRLTSQQVLAYSYTVQDPARRADLLRQILGRKEPLPNQEYYLRSSLAEAEIKAGQYDQAEEQMKLVLACTAPDNEMAQSLLRLAFEYESAHRPVDAKRWMQVVIDKYPNSGAAKAAKMDLDRMPK